MIRFDSAIWALLLGGLISNSFAQDKALLDKGKRLYIGNCLSCHNKDPNKKGPVGPELTDTSIEVMAIKITTGRYPEPMPAGQVPKRKSKMMKAFPHLKNDVPAIHAYIQSFKKK